MILAVRGGELGNAGLEQFLQNFKFLEEAQAITLPPPAWTTRNRIALDLDTMLLRDFSLARPTPLTAPVLSSGFASAAGCAGCTRRDFQARSACS